MTNTPDDADAVARRERIFDALNVKTAAEWNTTARIRVMSWNDFDAAAHRLGVDPTVPMTWAMFRKIRMDDVSVLITVPWQQLTDDD